MKKAFVGAFSTVAGVGVVAMLAAARYQATIRPNTTVGKVPVGGLTPDAAAKRVREWWETEKRQPLVIELGSKKLGTRTPGQLGVTLDDGATIARMPIVDLTGDVAATVTRESYEPQSFGLVFKSNGQKLDELSKLVAQAIGPPKPARAHWRHGKVVAVPEVGVAELDTSALQGAVEDAIKGDHLVHLPVKQAPKQVPDAALAQIQEVASQFTTHFSTGKRTRCHNIRLAAAKFDGVVLMPGQTLSFNQFVGRRTIRGGFEVAGVYKNGKHDTDVGGGICQVSTTLYNALLFGDFKIVTRFNHSLPVPYVPLGRDATVDYPSRDLVFENNTKKPIAVESEYRPGALTFRILGQKDPTRTVKILQGPRSESRNVRTETTYDPSLPVGKKRIVSRGSPTRSRSTFRVVYENGVEVRREPLGRSSYLGGPRVVAIGTKKPKDKPAAPPAATSPTPAPPQSRPGVSEQA